MLEIVVDFLPPCIPCTGYGYPSLYYHIMIMLLRRFSPSWNHLNQNAHWHNYRLYIATFHNRCRVYKFSIWQIAINVEPWEPRVTYRKKKAATGESWQSTLRRYWNAPLLFAAPWTENECRNFRAGSQEFSGARKAAVWLAGGQARDRGADGGVRKNLRGLDRFHWNPGSGKPRNRWNNAAVPAENLAEIRYPSLVKKKRQT